jgi:hypothetical protein
MVGTLQDCELVLPVVVIQHRQQFSFGCTTPKKTLHRLTQLMRFCFGFDLVALEHNSVRHGVQLFAHSAHASTSLSSI